MTANSTILVTGGTGFLGSYILRMLVADGYKNVKAIKRKSSRMNLVASIEHKVEWIEADLFDYEILVEALQDVEIVIHSAAIISFVKRDFKNMMRVNVDGTTHIVNASLEAGVEKLLHISSIAALGRTKNELVIDENTVFQHSPLDTGYGLSKHLAEHEIWRGESEGLDVGIINPAMIMGAGNWGNGSAKLIDTVYNDLTYYPLGSTGFVDVRDVARMSLAMLQNEQAMGQRMICCGENMKIRDMINMICQALNKKPPTMPLSPWLRAIAWRLEWLRSRLTGQMQLITKETLRTSAQSFGFNNARSIETLDFQYKSLQETIAETCIVYLDSVKRGENFGVLPLSS